MKIERKIAQWLSVLAFAALIVILFYFLFLLSGNVIRKYYGELTTSLFECFLIGTGAMLMIRSVFVERYMVMVLGLFGLEFVLTAAEWVKDKSFWKSGQWMRSISLSQNDEVQASLEQIAMEIYSVRKRETSYEKSSID